MRVKISYFALLREQAGMGHEETETSSSTADELYRELAARYRFTLPLAKVKVAINDVSVADDSLLRQGDHVIFIPPVSGG